MQAEARCWRAIQCLRPSDQLESLPALSSCEWPVIWACCSISCDRGRLKTSTDAHYKGSNVNLHEPAELGQHQNFWHSPGCKRCDVAQLPSMHASLFREQGQGCQQIKHMHGSTIQTCRRPICKAQFCLLGSLCLSVTRTFRFAGSSAGQRWKATGQRGHAGQDALARQDHSAIPQVCERCHWQGQGPGRAAT